MLSLECTLESKSNQSRIAGDSCHLQNIVNALKSVILNILNKYNSSGNTLFKGLLTSCLLACILLEY